MKAILLLVPLLLFNIFFLKGQSKDYFDYFKYDLTLFHYNSYLVNNHDDHVEFIKKNLGGLFSVKYQINNNDAIGAGLIYINGFDGIIFSYEMKHFEMNFIKFNQKLFNNDMSMFGTRFSICPEIKMKKQKQINIKPSFSFGMTLINVFYDIGIKFQYEFTNKKNN